MSGMGFYFGKKEIPRENTIFKNISMTLLFRCLHIHLEETGDLQKQSLETTSSTTVSTEEVQPVEVVNDPPNQVTVTPAKPKYR